jgi:hypothetical protein
MAEDHAQPSSPVKGSSLFLVEEAVKEATDDVGETDADAQVGTDESGGQDSSGCPADVLNIIQVIPLKHVKLVPVAESREMYL